MRRHARSSWHQISDTRARSERTARPGTRRSQPSECQTSYAPRRSTVGHAYACRAIRRERVANGDSPVDVGGAIWVPQGAYGPSDAGQDQQLALGGTYFEFQVVGSSRDGGLEVQLNVSDHYFWSPSDKSRSTQCLHVAGASLVTGGHAHEFLQVGEGRLTIADPSRARPMDPSDGPPGGSR